MPSPRQSTPVGHTASADLVRGLIECASRCGVSRIGSALVDGQAHRIVFPARAGDVRSIFADEDLKLLLAQVIEQHLEALGPADSFERGLAAVLRGMLNGTMPTLARLSARAGMSRRTLQRRLAESNTTFQRLLRNVLCEVSEELLARGTYTQGEIAFLQGYSEESAFSHAYRSWTGHAPGARRIRKSH